MRIIQELNIYIMIQGEQKKNVDGRPETSVWLSQDERRTRESFCEMYDAEKVALST